MSEINGLGQIAAALSEMLKEMTNIVGIVEKNLDAAFRISNKYALLWQKRNIDKLIYAFQKLSVTQRPIPDGLDAVVKLWEKELAKENFDGDVSGLRYFKNDIGRLVMVLSEIRDALDNNHSKYMYHSPELFENLYKAVLARELFVRKYSDKVIRGIPCRGNEPSEYFSITKDDIDIARGMASDYRALIDKMMEYRSLLGTIADGIDEKIQVATRKK